MGGVKQAYLVDSTTSSALKCEVGNDLAGSVVVIMENLYQVENKESLPVSKETTPSVKFRFSQCPRCAATLLHCRHFVTPSRTFPKLAQGEETPLGCSFSSNSNQTCTGGSVTLRKQMMSCCFARRRHFQLCWGHFTKTTQHPAVLSAQHLPLYKLCSLPSLYADSIRATYFSVTYPSYSTACKSPWSAGLIQL